MKALWNQYGRPRGCGVGPGAGVVELLRPVLCGHRRIESCIVPIQHFSIRVDDRVRQLSATLTPRIERAMQRVDFRANSVSQLYRYIRHVSMRGRHDLYANDARTPECQDFVRDLYRSVEAGAVLRVGPRARVHARGLYGQSRHR